MAELRQLTRQDVLFVAGETATIYQHTAGLVILDSSGSPDFGFEAFRDHVVERVGQIPHFSWKLHEVPLGLDLPYWVEDRQFSFDHHIKRIALPSPGDREALGEVVAHLYSRHLDRSKPLWEIWFIEGLADNRFAILQKLHHALMDGQGANKLGEIMCDFEPGAEPVEIDRAITSARAGKIPTPWRRSFNAAMHLSRLPGEASREILDFVRPKVLQRITGGQKQDREKPAIPVASFNAEIGSDRGFVFGSLPLADIKAVKNHFDVTVNDVVLALVGSSMRDYLVERGELPEASLRTSIAVSLRTEEDDEFSNKVTNTAVTLATDLSDAAQRLRAINAETGAAKEQARGGGRGLIEIMQMMPPLLVNAMINMVPAEQAPGMMGANLIVSNVRGSAKPMYIAGVRMETMYPMSIITAGMGINFTCVSYADNVDFGVTIEPELFPHAWAIIDGLERALRDYLALADKKPARKKRTGGKSRAAGTSAVGKGKTAARPRAATRKRPVTKSKNKTKKSTVKSKRS